MLNKGIMERRTNFIKAKENEIEGIVNSRRKTKNEQGITLVALVITIIIIIILATVTINMAFGDNGLITQAQLAKDMTLNAVTAEQEGMNSVMSEYSNVMAEDSEIPLPDTRSEIEKARDEGTVFEEKTELKDKHGNKVKVPAGFKVASDSGITIQQGIVIEDVSASTDINVQGSQYVWIPVGIFKKDDGTTSGNIQLARYTFDENGTPTPQQYATNYTESTVIETYYTELTTYDVGNESSGLDGKNATAKDLKGFIDSVNDNGGYYIGRYEASYASGSSTADYKAASKESNGYSTSNMSYIPETLWNFITQPAASKVAINTYADSTSVKSDLMNSYAWDTAIVYIQEAGYTNYANQTSKNNILADTGTNNDEVCKINDMTSNIREWTTEFSNYNDSSHSRPCVCRGGCHYYSIHYTVSRVNNFAYRSYGTIGFRVNLYI